MGRVDYCKNKNDYYYSFKTRPEGWSGIKLKSQVGGSTRIDLDQYKNKNN